MCAEAGYRIPRTIIPALLMMSINLAFEILGGFGLKTSINQPCMRRYVESTYIVPKKLLDLGYAFETDLKQGWGCRTP